MRTFFVALTWLATILSSQSVTQAGDSCQNVPIHLPEVSLLNITRFVPGQPGQVRLRLKSPHPLEFLWFKNIFKERQSYPAIIKDDANFRISRSHPASDEYESILKMKEATEDDTKYNRFTLEMTVKHPCATIRMKVLLGSDNILHRNIENPVTIEAISKQMVKKNIGDTLRLRLKATFTARPNERLYGPPISITKWYVTVSRSGIEDTLNLHSHDTDKDLPLNAHGVTNEVSKLNPGKYEAESTMTLNPLLQGDQGFYQCRLTYDLVRDVFIHVYATTEFRYSDRLLPALAVRPCSGLPNKKHELETKNGVLQVPVRAGMENCLQCYAHAVPDFLMVVAKINPDFSSGIQFVQATTKFDFGSLKRYIYPLAPVEEEVRYYICSAGRKDAINSVRVRVVPYEPVKLTELSPNSLNLLNTNRVIFTCRATGFPSPTITFYRAPKNSMLQGGSSPQDRGWVKMETGGNVDVQTSYASKVMTGIMVVEDVSADTNRGQFDYNCVAKNDYSSKSGTLFVDAFNRQSGPPVADVAGDLPPPL